MTALGNIIVTVYRYPQLVTGLFIHERNYVKKILRCCQKRHGRVEPTAGDSSRRADTHERWQCHRRGDRDGGCVGCCGIIIPWHWQRRILSFLFSQRKENQSARRQRQIAVRGEPRLLPQDWFQRDAAARD